MTVKKKILYIHGMGGGGDSRIPSILKDILRDGIEVIVRTYDFDPDKAHTRIKGWFEETHPDLVIGESLGAVHAIALDNCPHLLVSPSLNAPIFFRIMSWVVLIPGMTSFFDRLYHPKEGDRQALHFERKVLRKWPLFRSLMLDNSPARGSRDYFHAFFGTHDHYRRTGVVSVRSWKKYFGDTFTLYDGTHFMEEEYIRTLLVPRIYSLLR